VNRAPVTARAGGPGEEVELVNRAPVTARAGGPGKEVELVNRTSTSSSTEGRGTPSVVQQANPYLEQQAATATPAELTAMLYSGAVARVTAAIELLREGDHAEARARLLRTQEILLELRCSLDHEAGGQIAANLDRLYDFAYRKLVRAVVDRDTAPASEALEVLVMMRDTWREACLAPAPVGA
jgi:flagellar secretion chaperone FliS